MAAQEADVPTHSMPDCPEFQYRFFCKLFDDMIVRHVCVLRRTELNARGKFSCSGCSKDRIITAMSHRTEALRTWRS